MRTEDNLTDISSHSLDLTLGHSARFLQAETEGLLGGC